MALRALKLSAPVVIAMPDKRSVFVSRLLSGDKSRSRSPIRRAIRSGRSVLILLVQRLISANGME
jgi:hypothetical protein